MTARRGTRVTLVDVARLAGVDKAIVSRVVNEDPSLVIRPDTRERVVEAIQNLGYRPNVAARSLRTAKAGTLGLVIPDFANPVYAEIITGAESAALAQGHVLVTGSSTGANSSMDRYLDLLGQGRVDGLMLASPTTAHEQQKLESLGLPWMMVNRRDTGDHHRFVILNDAQAAKLAVEHLLELGHQEIVHVAGPFGADTARRRATGYRQAMKLAGLDVRAESIARGDYTPGGGADAMAQLLRGGVLSPTAVFVANVAMAVGVLDTLRRNGLRVPEDVSVVAVHDLPLAEHLVPALTTVRMPLQELGARAVELLLASSPEDEVAEVVNTAMELVQRESTAPLTRD
ncbi:LacI family DNA-binding transcriptional regulator [Actinoplanes sp. Pm04-4]|uniref:LacI family DNA-binding transcriptional regulator n=1 Tax=Paractinoplanes pyxinae TaxID=2997416 RepID=A0ABT4B5T0_9ACTN|nr:LacI family DNA-binding transcriptional regulator [Actinoplanes pyxinae]MCY1141858.1 LacI family DNA-binding transcriptional regulator [Actinoplanes pyxinae]